MSKKRDETELRLLEREPEVAETSLVQIAEIDVAESLWDPWLLALARMEAQSEVRLN